MVVLGGVVFTGRLLPCQATEVCTHEDDFLTDAKCFGVSQGGCLPCHVAQEDDVFGPFVCDDDKDVLNACKYQIVAGTYKTDWASKLFRSVRRRDYMADGQGALKATYLKIVRVARVINASWQKWSTDKNKKQSRRAKS